MPTESLQSSILDDPSAMVLSDPNLPDNPLVFVNDAFEKIMRYSRDAALGRNCRFLQCDETDDAARRKLRDAIASGTEVSADLIDRKADGTRFLNRVVVVPLRDEDGRIHSFLGIQSEIAGGVDDQSVDIGDRNAQMLRELQHRVKNHRSMVVCLIRVQSRKDVTRESFESPSNRVQTLAFSTRNCRPLGSSTAPPTPCPPVPIRAGPPTRSERSMAGPRSGWTSNATRSSFPSRPAPALECS